MKVRAQIGMVLNLDKCIGCHTCSVTCKNVWTSREGVEYAWFNNVETKPGVGYPREWENQKRWNGGWERTRSGKIQPRMGPKWRILAKIFANPDLPEIDDYYEPFDFDYAHLQTAPEMQAFPTARPRSQITGQRMEKIEWGPNWEEILGGEFAKRSADSNFDGIQKEMYGQFENTFMMYLPRLCEHCLNPIVRRGLPFRGHLQARGRRHRPDRSGQVPGLAHACVSGCPYKKIYYNWSSGKSEKCTFCYPRLESGMPTVCSETCVGRIRYLGRHPLRRGPHRGSRQRRREGSLRDAARDLSRPKRSDSDCAGARRRRAGGVDGSGAPKSGLQNGDGVEGRVSASSGISHAADGLVRPAAVANPVGGVDGRDRTRRRHARCEERCASRCNISPIC